ncbi:MAG TPA: potassium-transporting ATPase subunit KdpC [Terriglobales bacterium]|jgi:K+-transporting ATPase ATPase C chain
MRQNLKIAILFTIVTTVLLGIIYPLIVTGLSQVLFHDKANGQLISRNGEVIGSRIIGQTFAAPGYLHSRPSAAGNGYDAANSGGTNYGPTNQKLIDRVKADTERLRGENPGAPIPIELVTTSASGLDPDLSPAGADFQVPRIAHERGLSEEQVRAIIAKYSCPRQLGYLGEARVNVLEVNLALDEAKPMSK